MYNNANKEFYSELEKILKTARIKLLNCNNYHVMDSNSYPSNVGSISEY